MFNIFGYKIRLNLLQLLLVLLLALVLCPILGGHCGFSEGLENATDHEHDENSIKSITQSSSAEPTGSSELTGRVKNPSNPASVIRPKYLEPQPLTSIESRSKTDIPVGDEDLYILRSEVASLLNKPSCSPCPPCGRCPEPSFTCKKVPNYNNVHSQNFLPKPVLNDFSTFAQ